MNAFARVVFGQPGSQIARVSSVMLGGVRFALENVGVEHVAFPFPDGMPTVARSLTAQPSSFAKAMEDTILRSAR